MVGGILNKASESTVASAASVTILTETALVTGTTSIATINPPLNGGFNGILVIVPTDGTVATLTTGNIAVAVSMPQNRATVLLFSASKSKWYPGAIS